MRKILIYVLFNNPNAMKTEGMGTYPGYIDQIVEEAKENTTNVEVETDVRSANAAD